MLIANKINGIENNNELIEKCRKLLKIEEFSKSQKLFKSQKLAKLWKKLSKCENSLNFDAKKAEPSFLISGARKIFNYLYIAFIKALIFQNFDLEYYI